MLSTPLGTRKHVAAITRFETALMQPGWGMMANFSVERDRGSDIVTCLVTGFLSDDEAEALLVQLKHQLQISRQGARP